MSEERRGPGDSGERGATLGQARPGDSAKPGDSDRPGDAADAPGEAALFISGASYTHPKGGSGRPVFRDLCCRIARGEFLCIAGVNGCGKSTLLCLAAGVYPLSGPAGTFFVLGADMAKSGQPRERAAMRTALMMQDAETQILGASVLEDILLGREGDATAHGEAVQWAGRLGLGDLLDAAPHTLSYGQKRKLCLAGALMRKPELLLLDEPFSGLDYPGILELRDILRSLQKEGVTIALSTHDLAPVIAFCDKLLFLSRDGQSLFGTPTELLPHTGAFGVRPPGAEAFTVEGEKL